MSLGELALGFASILFGFKHLSSGIKRIRGQSPQRRGLAGSPLSTQRARTPIGEIRLRTYEIKNLEDRITYLKDLVQQGKRDPAVYEFARRAINSKCGKGWCVPEKDNLREVQALFKAIRSNVRYTSDISGVDSYQKAGHTLALKTADCDDYAVLVCSALGSLGIPSRFKVIRTKGSNDWNHIFAQAGLPRRKPTKWVSLDASVSMPMGWQAPPQLVSASKVFLI